MEVVVGHTAQTVLNAEELAYLYTHSVDPDFLLEMALDHVVDYFDFDHEFLFAKFDEIGAEILDLPVWYEQLARRLFEIFLKLIRSFKPALAPIVLSIAEYDYRPVRVLDFGNEHFKRVILSV